MERKGARASERDGALGEMKVSIDEGKWVSIKGNKRRMVPIKGEWYLAQNSQSLKFQKKRKNSRPAYSLTYT